MEVSSHPYILDTSLLSPFYPLSRSLGMSHSQSRNSADMKISLVPTMSKTMIINLSNLLPYATMTTLFKLPETGSRS